MKIILANGVELNPYTAEGGGRFLQGANRDCLTFAFPTDVGIEAIDNAFSEAACESIAIYDGNGNEYIHKGYTIRVSLVKNPVEVTPATLETEAVYEDRILITMAQRTYSESQVKAMAEDITNTQLALCEVYELMV